MMDIPASPGVPYRRDKEREEEGARDRGGQGWEGGGGTGQRQEEQRASEDRGAEGTHGASGRMKKGIGEAGDRARAYHVGTTGRGRVTPG